MLLIDFICLNIRCGIARWYSHTLIDRSQRRAAESLLARFRSRQCWVVVCFSVNSVLTSAGFIIAFVRRVHCKCSLRREFIRKADDPSPAVYFSHTPRVRKTKLCVQIKSLKSPCTLVSVEREQKPNEKVFRRLHSFPSRSWLGQFIDRSMFGLGSVDLVRWKFGKHCNWNQSRRSQQAEQQTNKQHEMAEKKMFFALFFHSCYRLLCGQRLPNSAVYSLIL